MSFYSCVSVKAYSVFNCEHPKGCQDFLGGELSKFNVNFTKDRAKCHGWHKYH